MKKNTENKLQTSLINKVGTGVSGFKNSSLNSNKKAFTLIEIMVGITLFSIIITSGFYAFSAVSVGKIKLIGQTGIEKESYFFSERLFEEIKKGGVIDFEEYFNRKVVGNTTFSSGHYEKDTGFGNFGSGGIVGTDTYGDYFYFCRSGNLTTLSMGTGGCYDNDFNNYSASVSGKPQRFGQYTFQFMDYNSNMNDDSGIIGDENGDGNIVGDDDDENIGIGPEALANSGEVQELYLVSGNKKTRTLFRWNVIEDPDRPTGVSCDFSIPKTPTGSGCLGTIEFLKLDLKDLGKNHDLGTGAYDGTPETWIINPDFAGTGGVIAGSNSGNYWVSLFPKSINVKELDFFLLPNKDINLSWKDSLSSSNFSPYLRIKYTLTPSRSKRGGIKGEIPKLTFSTTITLSDLFSQK
ncbi:MAG: prepilin-type N-terminal cleavage/methylation domain-containing protein [Candidatus Gracilibacteria bacterium]